MVENSKPEEVKTTVDLTRSCTKNNSSNSNSSNNDRKSKSKGISCKECESYGHIQDVCPTYLRREKSIIVTSNNEEQDEDHEEEEYLENFVAFTLRRFAYINIETTEYDSTNEEVLTNTFAKQTATTSYL